MNLFSLFRNHATFAHGGVHPLEHKDETAGLPIRRMPFAPKLVVPLSQHKGAPAKPIVKAGQEVVRGEPVAVADGYVSVPMHAPATGRVSAVDLWATAEGPKAPAIVIDVYDGATQEILYEDPVDIMHLAADEIVQAVKDAGLVGLGGAAFPSHVKLLPPDGKSIHTVVVNGCECEPYLTCDHRLMLERPTELIAGIRIVARALGVRRVMIGIEDDKLDAVAVLEQASAGFDWITVHAVQTKYPQGAEKMLIKSLLGRDVPPGAYPSAVGVSVFNVSTLTEIGELLPRGHGVIERVVTVTGAGVEKPGNYLTPVGTPVRYLLAFAGARPDVHELILGGPMMGMSVAALDVPVTKAVSGMVVLTAGSDDLAAREVRPCIGCGWCVEACPMHLNPSLLGKLAGKGEYAVMAETHHLNDCFECGCCSYVCPSNIPLVQYFRVAKSVNRDRAA
jgi:electron transport complex protein RnfC